MLLSIATLSGFKQEIQKKISAVQGDFIIDSGRNIESGEPFPLADDEVKSLDSLVLIPGISRVIPSASKACIIKSSEDIEGLIAKGIDNKSRAYFKSAYQVHLETRVDDSNGCWISSVTAKRLKIDTGDRITVVFFVTDNQNYSRPRARRLRVTALYQTGIDKIDAQMILVNQNTLKTFLPPGNTYTQIEIWKDKAANSEFLKREIRKFLPSGYVRLNTLQEYNRLIFDWLAILNTNVWIILILMALVAITGMSTTLLIIIIENTSKIGLLLALGARFKDISRMFVLHALIIAVVGVLFGNILTAIVVYGQNTFQWIQLNQQIYFIPYVRLTLDIWDWIWVDLAAIGVIGMSLWLPARYIRKIDLIKAITFK